MQTLKAIFSTTLVLTVGLFCAVAEPAAETPSKKPVYRLPKDLKATIISLDFRGGYGPPRTNDDPTMSILADGTVLMPANYAHRKTFKGKLTQAELQDLLHFIIGTNQFFRYDSKAVQEKIRAEKQRLRAAGRGFVGRIVDAATAVIRVTASGKTNEVSYYPSGIDERAIKELRQRQAIQKRLQQVMSIVQLGGNKEVAKWLKLANRELKAQFPGVKPLQPEHLISGSERTDGSKYVNFSRRKIGPDGKLDPQSYFTTIVIHQQAGKPPTINAIHRKPVTKRPSRTVPGSKL